MSEQMYTCDDCGECNCSFVTDCDDGELPENCMFGGGYVNWTKEFNESEAIEKLEKRGYVCIKKTREE